MAIKKILAPWVLVLIGIAFNIFAAVITHYFIDQNNIKLDQLEEQTQRIDTRINSDWQDRQNIERKMEFILLLKMQQKQLASQEPFIAQYIKNFIQNLVSQYKISPVNFAQLDAQQITQVVQGAQEKIIDEIDEVYFDKLTLEKEKMRINSINSRLMSIALFLQLLGLILVLARDVQYQKSI